MRNIQLVPGTRDKGLSLNKFTTLTTRISLLIALAMALSACTSQPGKIKSFYELESGQTALIGSRQRAILNIEVGEGSRPGLVNPKRVVCAEPSPDVALAIAQSFGFGGSLLTGGGQGAVSTSSATAEGIAQLGERTQSIQLLRDQMYRACEAFANGAITGTTYNLIMSKNNDVMVTLMLGEVAGGAFGRSGAAIGGKSDAEGKASTTSLVEALQAADQADKSLESAEQEQEAAAEKVDDKMEIAANDAAATEETQDNNDDEVKEAEGELVAAEKNVQNKREIKNDAESKAQAEITKVVGVGSISSKPTVGIAQLLVRLQDNYFGEDFTDEYVTACLVEMGLASAGATEFTRKNAEFETKVRVHMLTNILSLDVSDEFLRKRSETYLDLVAKLGALERYTLLAKHCSGNLEKFLIFARNGEVALEQDRIRLEYQRILQEGDATRKEALEVLEKSLKTCAANEDPATRKKCVDAVTTLIERPGGTIELSAPTIIQSPSVRPPLPLVDYDAAKAKKSSFDFRFGKLVSGLIPTLDPAKLNTEDATKLAAPHKNLTDNQAAYLDQTKHGSAASLKSKADKAITTQMRTKVETLQKLRPALHSAVVSAAGSDALTLKAAQLALDLHDTTAKLKLREYQELHDALDAMTDKIVKHLKAVSDLEAAINTAEEKKANAASESQ